jgi:hypothetical protein
MSKTLSDVFPDSKITTYRVKLNPKDRKFVHDRIVHAIVTRNLSDRANECIRSGPRHENAAERRYQESLDRKGWHAEEKRVRAELAAKNKK